MKIKKKSWHYRFFSFNKTWIEDNTNLCRYFWNIVLKIFGLLLVVAILSAYVTLFILNPEVLVGLVICIFIIAAPIPVIYLLRKLIGKPIEVECENIVVEYVKAKKNKYCPMIEFVD